MDVCMYMSYWDQLHVALLTHAQSRPYHPCARALGGVEVAKGADELLN